MSHLPRISEESLQECMSDLEDVQIEGNRCRTCDLRRTRWFRNSVAIPWLLSLSLLFWSITLELSTSTPKWHNPKNYWAETDFEAVGKDLPAATRKVRFTAGLRYNEDRELVRSDHPNLPEYVGTPSPELDAAWEDFVGAVNVFVTPKEERELEGDLYLDTDTDLYMAELTVFHDLHCLNMIRKSLHYYWDDYSHTDRNVMQPHLDHCIDSLRQSIMCAGDMTVAPSIWDKNKGRFIPNFEVEHTCRDYDALKTWSLNRDSAHQDRWPKNAARLHAAGS